MMNDTPKLKRDWVKRYVRLNRRIETRNGVIFEPGEIMYVYGYYHGLKLEALYKCPHCNRGYRAQVTKVQCDDVTIMPLDFKPEKRQ